MGLGLGKSYICLNFISSVCFISKIKKIKTIKENICQTIRRIVHFSFLMLEVSHGCRCQILLEMTSE